MEFLESLLQGYTPILLFILICFAALLIMFYRVVRSLDDVVRAVTQDREAAHDTVKEIRNLLEILVHRQADGASPGGAQPQARVPGERSGHAPEPPFPSEPSPFDVAVAGGVGAAAGAATLAAGALSKDESLPPPTFEDSGDQEAEDAQDSPDLNEAVTNTRFGFGQLDEIAPPPGPASFPEQSASTPDEEEDSEPEFEMGQSPFREEIGGGEADEEIDDETDDELSFSLDDGEDDALSFSLDDDDVSSQAVSATVPEAGIEMEEIEELPDVDDVAVAEVREQEEPDVSLSGEDDDDLVFSLDEEEEGEGGVLDAAAVPGEAEGEELPELDFSLDAPDVAEEPVAAAQEATAPVAEDVDEAEDDGLFFSLDDEKGDEAQAFPEEPSVSSPDEDDILLLDEPLEEDPNISASVPEAREQSSVAPELDADLFEQIPDLEEEVEEVEDIVFSGAGIEEPDQTPGADALLESGEGEAAEEDMFSDSLGIVPDFGDEEQASASLGSMSEDEVIVAPTTDEEESESVGDTKPLSDEELFDAMGQELEVDVVDEEPDQGETISLDVDDNDLDIPLAEPEEHDDAFSIEDISLDEVSPEDEADIVVHQDTEHEFTFDQAQESSQDVAATAPVTPSPDQPAASSSEAVFEDEPTEQHVDFAPADGEDHDLDLLIEKLSDVELDEGKPDDEAPDFETELVLEDEEEEPETELDIPVAREGKAAVPPPVINMDEDEEAMAVDIPAPARSGHDVTHDLGASDDDFSLDDLGVVLDDEQVEEKSGDDAELELLPHDVFEDEEAAGLGFSPHGAGGKSSAAPMLEDDDLLSLEDIDLVDDSEDQGFDMDSDPFLATQQMDGLDDLASFDAQGDAQTAPEDTGKAGQAPAPAKNKPRGQAKNDDDLDMDIDFVLDDDKS